MTSPRRLAVSYSRLSDPKQAKGSGEDRQEKDFRTFCTLHNLTPSGEVYADRLSGYKDHHRQKGRLGQLIQAAKDGKFEAGTVIVVEAWDRLGRLRPDKQTALVAELVGCGVGIGVCRLNDIFVEEDFGTHKWTTLAVFIQLAYQESKQKGERVAHSWVKRQADARENGSRVTSIRPYWIDADGNLIPEKAAAVHRVFELAAAGNGHRRIIKALLTEGVKPLGDEPQGGKKGSRFGHKWTRAYVALLLRDRRVLGEQQYLKTDGTPAGPPIVGYYKVAVEPDLFALAGLAQEGRLSGKDAAGRQRMMRESPKHINVFKGLLRHARDGGGWLLTNRQTTARPNMVLLNAGGAAGRDCCYTFPYPVFEEEILGRLIELDPAKVLPRKDGPSRAHVLRAKLAEVRARQQQAKSDYKARPGKSLAEIVNDLDAEEERAATELQEELARTVKPVEKAWEELPGLVQMIRKEGDAARLRIRPVLRSIVTEVWLLLMPRGAVRLLVTQLHFPGGAHRDYLTYLSPAANHRPRVCHTADYKFDAGPIDLRKPADVARLAAALETVPLGD
jgi:DNA invertase Pin-like site-specific DNA recombinase